MSTTTVRKLRFPMLIGGGIIAAGVLVYFSSGYINSQKTQGAIGQRDVYRDGEVKASDVAATPGAAPVAMTAILQSKEYESLAKNPAFLALLSDRSFLEVVHNANFQTLMQEATFRGLLASSHSRTSAESETAALVEAMQAEVRAGTMTQVSQDALNRLRNDSAFAGVLHNTSFRGLVADKAFAGLVTSAAFQSALASSMASLRPHD